MESFIGKYVIVRSSQSGCHFGVVKSITVTGEMATVALSNSRRIYSWDGAGSLSELAEHGARRDGSRICAVVESTLVMGVCEVLLCQPSAVDWFVSQPVWRP